VEEKENITIRRIQESLQDGRLPCAAAHAISEETGVPLARIGEIADDLKIKISKCQLGCF
jgi:hypothetical protein